jgi:hypothetical protein
MAKSYKKGRLDGLSTLGLGRHIQAQRPEIT